MSSDFLAMFADQATAAVARIRQSLDGAAGRTSANAALFRDIHNIKAEAALVGVGGVVALTTVMEAIVTDPTTGARQLSAADVDALTQGVAALEVFAQQARDGDVSAGAPEGVLQLLEEAVHRMTDSAGSGSTDSSASALSELRIQVAEEYLSDVVSLTLETRTLRLRLGDALAARGIDPVTIPDFRSMERILADLEGVVIDAHAVPLQFLEQSLHRVVREVSRAAKKRVAWSATGEDVEVELAALGPLTEALSQLIVNAIDQGIESPDERRQAGKAPEGQLSLGGSRNGSQIHVTLADDGRGMSMDRLRARAAALGLDTGSPTDEDVTQLVFHPALLTPGSGSGLDLVRDALDRLRGRIIVRLPRSGGTEFTLIIPCSLAVVSALTVQTGPHRLAIPMYSVDGILPAASERSSVGGRWMLREAGGVTPVASLNGLVGESPSWEGPVVVLIAGAERHAFVCDAIVGRHDIAVKSLPRILPQTTLVGGVAVESDGTLLLTLDARSAIERANSASTVAPAHLAGPSRAAPPRQRILVVDDSLAVRELQRVLLERAGFDVELCAGGGEALSRLDVAHVDLILADVEMPGMNGYELVRAVRGHRRHRNLPIVMVTSHASDEQRRQGLEAGADGYIDKQNFDESALVDTIGRLLGERSAERR